MNGDITDNKSMSSVQVSGREQSINTSRYSRRNIDHDEVLLTWDETATRGLTKEEQSKVYNKLKTKFRIKYLCFYSDKQRDAKKTLMHFKASDGAIGWKRDYFSCKHRSAGTGLIKKL